MFRRTERRFPLCKLFNDGMASDRAHWTSVDGTRHARMNEQLSLGGEKGNEMGSTGELQHDKTLRVNIIDEAGKVVHVVELPDPRVRFAEIWNECPFHQLHGHKAVPA